MEALKHFKTANQHATPAPGRATFTLKTTIFDRFSTPTCHVEIPTCHVKQQQIPNVARWISDVPCQKQKVHKFWQLHQRATLNLSRGTLKPAKTSKTSILSQSSTISTLTLNWWWCQGDNHHHAALYHPWITLLQTWPSPSNAWTLIEAMTWCTHPPDSLPMPLSQPWSPWTQSCI